VWEFVERAGDYGAPIALTILAARHAPARAAHLVALSPRFWRRFSTTAIAISGGMIVAIETSLPAAAVALRFAAGL
jgi:hypothetical protein